ncbi:MAG: CHC2 zinc finger domain-containing protein [Bryobacteraceae bacterium]
MTAREIAAQLRGRKSGAGFVAPCPSHEDKSPSLSLRDAEDGRVLVHCFGGCEQRDVIDALRGRGLWPERERRDWTPEDRQRWAAERRAIERDLPEARYWRRAAVDMAEEALVNLKAALFAPDEPQPDTAEIHRLTQQLAAWKRMDGADLIREYQKWQKRAPGFAWAMTEAAREREKSEAYAICKLFGFGRHIADQALGRRSEAVA